jgi:hypothetical protein
MKQEYLTRQSTLIPIDVLGMPINVIGCGAVGGWTTLALAKMGFLNLRIFDFDTVDEENMNSQFFRVKDIGKPKAEALASLIEDFTGVKIEYTSKRYEGGMLPGIVVAAVDSMEARKMIFESIKNSGATQLYIDPRMGAESALMYAMDPGSLKDRDTYLKTLYTDSDAVQEPCTAKSTVYCATMLSGLVARTVKGFCVDKVYPRTVQWDIKKNAFQAWSNK